VVREEGVKIDRMIGKATNPGRRQMAAETDKDQGVVSSPERDKEDRMKVIRITGHSSPNRYAVYLRRGTH
jgi:hypothetical protein